MIFEIKQKNKFSYHLSKQKLNETYLDRAFYYLLSIFLFLVFVIKQIYGEIRCKKPLILANGFCKMLRYSGRDHFFF